MKTDQDCYGDCGLVNSQIKTPSPLYYGYYSNVSRGKRKKEDNDELIPSILEPDGSSKEFRRNWARLIQKIYETDPLCCPRCQGRMRIIAIIKDDEVIKKILKHLNLWERKARPPPLPKSQQIDTSASQLPPCEDHLHLYCDTEYPMEAYAS
jgi:hypothetical protein